MQAAPKTEDLKVLLVEDDEDDYILTRTLFAEIKGQRFQLVWVKSFQAGLQEMIRNQQDVCLVDYRLGAQNGIHLLRRALRQGCQSPILLPARQGRPHVDLGA